MYFDKNMSTEAHKLIGISLSKIAQSRASRGGVSLHKNLLVATVLHKARYIFMEEAYQIVHGSSKGVNPQPPPIEERKQPDEIDESTADQVLAEELADDDDSPTEDRLLNEFNQEWERQSETSSYQAHIELTYLNLEKNNLKRRRETSSWEVEEAVLSILPKRTKVEEATPMVTGTTTTSEFTFFDESDFLTPSDTITKVDTPDKSPPPPPMEIDRISSLVSIFSFTNLTDLGNLESEIKLNKSDQCSAQAKSDHNSDSLQPISSFLAMTV